MIAAISVNRVIAVVYPLRYKSLIDGYGLKVPTDNILGIADYRSNFNFRYSCKFSTGKSFNWLRKFFSPVNCVLVLLANSDVIGQTPISKQTT